MVKRVAIIGAGPSGLVSAKSAIEQNIDPVIFEKNESLGGIWNSNTGFVWSTMHTNISRYTGTFSDFPWNPSIPLFPNSSCVKQYLNDYAKHFQIDKYINFNTLVESVNIIENKKWLIETVNLKT